MFLRNILKTLSLNKRNSTMNLQENQISIHDKTINILKTGTGSCNVLCLPGLLGTIWTDFPNQIKQLNKSILSVVFMDMPGCGRSRPPNRTFPPDFYHKDAEFAAGVMRKLEVPRYNLIGWSDGGISALILASEHPDKVDKLVVWGANAYVSKADVKLYQGIKDLDKWSPRMIEPFLKVYQKEEMAMAMAEWYNTLENIEKKGGDICVSNLKNIKASTLIVHGDKDPLVSLEHAEFLHKNISNSKLIRFPDGKHNLHHKYYKEFNELVEKFFSSH